MSKCPYINVSDDDEDEQREAQFRRDRKATIQAKKYIGSGEDGGELFNQFNQQEVAQVK